MKYDYYIVFVGTLVFILVLVLLCVLVFARILGFMFVSMSKLVLVVFVNTSSRY